MEMVQKQRTQLKMKFSLGYNIIALWGGWKFGGTGSIFPGGRRLSKECADDGISVK